MNQYFYPDFEKQEFKNALARYEEMRKEDANYYFDTGQFADIAEYYIVREAYKDASQVVEHALKIHPGNVDILIIKSHVLLLREEIDEAKAVIESIAEDSMDLELLKVELLLVEDKTEEAHKFIDNMVEKRGNIDKEDYRNIFYLYKDFNLPEKAIEWLEKSVRQFPMEDHVMMDMADCYTEIGKTEKAISIYNHMLDSDPYHPGYWYGLGKIYYLIEDFNKAIEAYEFVLTIIPEHAKAELMMAHCYFALENFEKAAEFYLKYGESEDNKSEVPIFFCAMSHFTAGNFEKALSYLFKALEKAGNTSPRLVEIYTYISITSGKINNMEQALDYIDRAIEENKYLPELYIYKGSLYLDMEEKEKAVHCFSEAIEKKPHEMMTYNRIGLAYFEHKNWHMALYAFSKIAETEPGYGLSYIYMAYIYLQLGEKESFRKYFTEAIKDDPEKVSEFLDSLAEEDREIKQLIMTLKAAILKDKQSSN